MTGSSSFYWGGLSGVNHGRFAVKASKVLIHHSVPKAGIQTQTRFGKNGDLTYANRAQARPAIVLLCFEWVTTNEDGAGIASKSL